MTKIHIVGQAPARSGDGRPFTGQSGTRLCELLGLINYDALSKRFILENLVNRPMQKHLNGRGDQFDAMIAQKRATLMLRTWLKSDELTPVIACGHLVFKTLTNRPKPFFKGTTIRVPGRESAIEVWNFPHPSGASAFWNDPKNVREARAFLNRLVKRYGVDMQ
jgi:uracil-DNA glycosylase